MDPVPTTEAIAALLLREARAMDLGGTCVQVKVTEGPNNEALVVI